MIHCPSCGQESSLEQKFCRKCGFNLEPVSQLVASASGSETKLVKHDDDRAILGRMVRWMMWGGLVLLIGLIMLVTGKAFDGIPKFLSPFASVLLIGGTAMMGYGVLAALREGAAPRTLRSSETGNQLSASSTNELADGMPMPLPSVTERTTQLIERGSQTELDEAPTKPERK
jgi:predicted lipid-binding transport protein (Tim44 family)